MVIPEGGRDSMRAWARDWEAKAVELHNAAAILAKKLRSRHKAGLMARKAGYFRAASAAAYEAAFEFGRRRDHVANKRWVDAIRHAGEAEAIVV